MIQSDSPIGLVARVIADLIIALVFARLFFMSWRQKYRKERRIQKSIMDDEREGATELIKSEVGMLKLKLGETQIARDNLINAMRQSVAFDLETVVTPEEGGQFTFVFLGCAAENGKFLGLYACPACSGKVKVPQNAASDEEFKAHLGMCPGLHKAMIAT
jgi:hypothetical protein